jgi:hypothetical protein
MANPSEALNPNLEDQDMVIKPTVMGPPAYGSPDPLTATAALLPVVDHPNRASLSEDYGKDVIEDSNLASTRGEATESYDEMKVDDLKTLAKTRELDGYSTMNKKELVKLHKDYDEAQAVLDEDEDEAEEASDEDDDDEN